MLPIWGWLSSIHLGICLETKQHGRTELIRNHRCILEISDLSSFKKLGEYLGKLTAALLFFLD